MQESLKKKYFKLKEEMVSERHSETLRKFKMLNKAYTLGKQIYKLKFSVQRLAYDFEIPYTSTKRILSLRYATKKSWGLIKSNKISSFKVAQVCLTKDRPFQDEIISLIIEKNLSTYQIKEFINISNKRIKHKKQKRIRRSKIKNRSRRRILKKRQRIQKSNDNNKQNKRIISTKKRIIPRVQD